jgi:uncharacterized protein (DUF1015 family)
MADVRPFRALRPREDLAADIIAPPYDVLDEDEARAIAVNPRSFLHVTRSEVDLAPGTDAHSDVAYRRARTNLDRFEAEGLLMQDASPTYYLYGQKMGDHVQVGVLAACSVDEYDRGLIAKHEFTRPDKEDDRTHHMDVLDAQVGLVFLTYRSQRNLDGLLEALSEAPPAWKVTTADAVEHTFWVVPTNRVADLQEAFANVPKLYVADGHHRSAAASRIHAKRGDDASAYFLAGIFPSDRLQVMAYNRVLHDLHGHSPEALLGAIAERFDVSDGPSTPDRRGEFSMVLEGRWYRLVPKHVPSDPVGRLDASVLQEQLLRPLLGIEDPRRSQRITFVGGIHGPERVEALAAKHGGVGFHLFPTGLDQLFDVADAGEVMPPKSTWFEPKLRGGVAVRKLT